jgi:opacity protein-like surface antigen
MMALVVAVASEASAQPLYHGHVQGVGGVTFGTERSQIFGGGLAVSINPNVQVIVDIGRMSDVVPRSIRREIDDAMETLSVEMGVPIRASVGARAIYWTTGLRLAAPARGRVTPFAQVTVGSAHVSPRLSFEIDGFDVTPTDEELEEAGLKSGRNPMLGAGAGVEIAVVRRLAVELGYQFNRIFTKDPAVSTQRVYTGLNVRF